MSNQINHQYLNLFDSLLHVNNISARIAFNTTALGVVILMPSYEESVNMSRCNFDRLNPLLKGIEMPSRPQVHEFSI
jgi:hypothetical protein